MELSLPQGPGATFVEPEPDGRITIVFKHPQVFPETIYFKDMTEKGWCWKSGETGRVLVVYVKPGHRIEYPEVGIKCVEVVSNSQGYCLWRDMEDAARHTLEIAHHLDQANDKFEKAKEAYFKWRATS